MEPELAEEIYLLDRCIECGCCVAGCGTARMREDFVGAVDINRIARFEVDPRDTRTDEDFYELIGDDSGVFGCMSLLACHDVCPKNLPLQSQIAFIRRKMVRMGWKNRPALDGDDTADTSGCGALGCYSDGRVGSSQQQPAVPFRTIRPT